MAPATLSDVGWDALGSSWTSTAQLVLSALPFAITLGILPYVVRIAVPWLQRRVALSWGPSSTLLNWLGCWTGRARRRSSRPPSRSRWCTVQSDEAPQSIEQRLRHVFWVVALRSLRWPSCQDGVCPNRFSLEAYLDGTYGASAIDVFTVLLAGWGMTLLATPTYTALMAGERPWRFTLFIALVFFAATALGAVLVLKLSSDLGQSFTLLRLQAVFQQGCC